MARGASYRNGLRVHVPVLASNVFAITKSVNGGALETLAPLAGHSECTVDVFTNAHALLPSPPGYLFANTDPGSPPVPAATIDLTIEFSSPVDPVTLGAAPYDIYLKRGGVEIHLPGQQPSADADMSLFGTWEDGTLLGTSYTYKTPFGQPWVLHLPESWKHPYEHEHVEQAYPSFVPWTRAAGLDAQDWYGTPEAQRVWPH